MEQREPTPTPKPPGAREYRVYVVACVLGLVVGLLFSPVTWVAIKVAAYQSPDSWTSFLGQPALHILGIALPLVSLLLVPFVLIAAPLTLFRKEYAKASLFIGVGIGMLPGYLSLPRLVDWRYSALTDAIQREEAHSKPLIQAIANYHQDRGVYPPVLEALVPKYLPQVPRTSFACYPNYQYLLPDPEDEYDRYSGYHLRIPLGTMMDYDDLNHWAPGNNPNPFGKAGTAYDNWTFFDD